MFLVRTNLCEAALCPAGLLCALVVSACQSDGEPSAPRPPLIFDRAFRSSYTEVRSCRSPGEHSGLNGFTVWVNPPGAASFAAIWQTPPAVSALADGAVVVKEIYTTPDCGPNAIDRWVAMRKESGLDPAHGDWHWQEVTADGRVTSDGAVTPDGGVARCASCHTGQASCSGYGESAGRDYLCTAP